MNVWIVSAHRSWGDRIEYHGHRGDTHRWMGWTRPIPKVGEVIETELKSGRAARFRIVEVERGYGTDDMWWATTSDAPIYGSSQMRV